MRILQNIVTALSLGFLIVFLLMISDRDVTIEDQDCYITCADEYRDMIPEKRKGFCERWCNIIK